MAKVLMIEDDPAHQKLASLLMEGAYDFAFANTVAEAAEYLKTQRADVVLLDLNLPDSMGMETLVAVVKLFPEMPIVVWAGIGDAAEAIRLGADEFILKNGDFGSVRDALASAIARHPFKSVREDIKALQKQIATDSGTEKK